MNDKTVSVRILGATHSHEGKPVDKGTVLTGISEKTAQHLVALGAAEIVTGSEPVANATTKAVPFATTKAPLGGTE